MREIMERLGFPREAVEFFLDMEKTLAPEEKVLFDSLRSQWMTEENDEAANAAVRDALTAWAEKRGISPYSVHMFFLVRCAPALRQRYAQKGIPEERFWDIMRDLQIKLRECHEVQKLWGTVSFEWFQREYTCSLIGLGRFQYERRVFDKEDVTICGHTLRKGDLLYGIHIPSGLPFTPEDQLASFRMAYEYFGIPKGEVLPVLCWSWLVWPEGDQFFPEGSNLRHFWKSFTIIGKNDPTLYFPPEVVFPDAWRVFGTEDCADLDALPADTTLRRNVLAYLKKGGRIGWGYGVLLFDGEKILTGSLHS